MKHIEAGMNMDIQVNDEADELIEELEAEMAGAMAQGPAKIQQA